jgi:hypothetical protein
MIPAHFDLIAKEFSESRIICFTSDIEWSPEWAIEKMYRLFDNARVPLTPFLTHESKFIARRFTEHPSRVGIHPNFLPQSSHGNSVGEVVRHCRKLWEPATAFRSHCFFDNTMVSNELYAQGFRYDSNLCLYQQSNLTPLAHASGLVRFPVWWEDDIHWNKGSDWRVETLQTDLEKPGLKIFNVHPLNVALNIPSEEFYLKHKSLFKENDAEKALAYTWKGPGVYTFLEELLDLIARQEWSVRALGDCYTAVQKGTL